MSTKRKLVDVKSYELAEHFLDNVFGTTNQDVQDLAEAIQTVCEDHCSEVEERGRLRRQQIEQQNARLLDEENKS